jgi:hypothetical protein
MQIKCRGDWDSQLGIPPHSPPRRARSQPHGPIGFEDRGRNDVVRGLAAHFAGGDVLIDTLKFPRERIN